MSSQPTKKTDVENRNSLVLNFGRGVSLRVTTATIATKDGQRESARIRICDGPLNFELSLSKEKVTQLREALETVENQI